VGCVMTCSRRRSEALRYSSSATQLRPEARENALPLELVRERDVFLSRRRFDPRHSRAPSRSSNFPRVLDNEDWQARDDAHAS
jgi:hypothetical protein